LSKSQLKEAEGGIALDTEIEETSPVEISTSDFRKGKAVGDLARRW